MGVIGKLEIETDIKISGNVIYELFVFKPNRVACMSPLKIQSCDILDGDFGKLGSIIQWHYTLDGVKHVAKETIEEINEEKKLLKFKCIEGSDLLKEFKSINVILQVINKGENDAIKWNVEFEKFDDFGPYPTNLMDFMISMTRDIEAYHLK